MADYKQLCAELLSALENEFYAHCPAGPDGDPLIERARAALAEPEPEGPTREQAVAVYSEVMAAHECQTLGEMAEHFTHAVLARWGNRQELLDSSPADGEVAELVAWMRNQVTVHEVAQTQWAKRFVRAASLLEHLSPPQPIPLDERLPGPEDCDDSNRVWCWSWAIGTWRLSCIKQSIRSHWLPAHALPLPQ